LGGIFAWVGGWSGDTMRSWTARCGSLGRCRPPCRIIGSDLKLRIGDRIRYPDAMVLGSPRVPGRVMVTDPVIVFEILGPGTAEIDLVQKSAEYRSLASVRRYVVLQQTDIAGFALVRKGDDWITQDLIGEAAILRLPEVGIEVPMADIYRDVIIPPQDDAPAP
jgi:Uma2 family endonuclease